MTIKNNDDIIEWLKACDVYEKVLSKTEHFLPMGKFTLLEAFIWKHTSEGFDYWNKINNKFIKWYES